MDCFVVWLTSKSELLLEIFSFIPVGIDLPDTAHTMKFSVKDFFSKCEQILKKLRIYSHLLKKSLTENFILCAV